MAHKNNKIICASEKPNDNNSRSTTPTTTRITHISLAHRNLKDLPKGWRHSGALKMISSLDLSYNSLQDLGFLEYFPNLQTLVLDRNFNLDYKTLPNLKNLEILWLNNCNLININEWLEKLETQCPNLTHLSMMCNPVGPTLLNGVTYDEETIYRRMVLEKLPKLQYFDGAAIEQSSNLNSTWSTKLYESALSRKWTSMYNVGTSIQKSFSFLEYFTFRRIFFNIQSSNC